MEETELFGQAAGGSSVAQSTLSEMAMDAAERGVIRPIEALAAAEVCSRLAAARGDVAESMALADILSARSTFELERGDTAAAAAYDQEATRLGEAIGARSGALLNASLLAAASGDVDAIGVLYDNTLRYTSEHLSDPIEGLVAAEVYGRLAAAGGAAPYRLIYILVARADYEFRAGASGVGTLRIIEALCLSAGLAEAGDEVGLRWLPILLTEHPAAAIAACEYRPSILLHIASQGTS
jgi:hypothetical protein